MAVELKKNLIWQYNKATALTSIVEQKSSWYSSNVQVFWSDWYSKVFNLGAYGIQKPVTATNMSNFGISVWAQILDLPLSVVMPLTDSPSWGFGGKRENFLHGNFASSSGGAASLTRLEKWQVLRMRYYRIVGNATVTYINNAIDDVFGPNVGYVTDPGDMTLNYFFKTASVSSNLATALENYEILPAVAGVKMTITRY